jgi:large subunit ribosomal protein L21
MYAVIKTGGKQYRVKPGDVLVVEKLDGEPGAKVAFDQVLMVGEGEAVTVGAPTVEGASVSGTFVETRKGDKVKIFKKTRRQGYRRTRGHRQLESVVRVTAIAGAGLSETWDGEVDLTPLAVLRLRARNLADRVAAGLPEDVDVETVVEPVGKGKSARLKAKVVEEADAVAEDAAPDEAVAEAEAKPAKAPAKKAAAKRPPAEGAAGFKNAANAKAPRQSKSQARAPIRKTSPRGKG